MAFDFSTAPQTPDLNLTNPAAGYAGYADTGFTPIPGGSPVSSAPLYGSMGLSAIGSLVTGLSQSRAQRAQGDYQSTLANLNSEIAGIKAKQTLETGDITASRTNLKYRGEIGSEVAAQGASGVQVGSGSAALVRGGIDLADKIDELTIKNNAARQAWGYQMQASEDTFAGKFAQLTAKAGSEQSLLTGGLGAIEGPLGIYAKNLYLQRWLGGGTSSNAGGVPFPSN